MDILGVIPARYGSTRFPGKLLAPLQGRPLILHTIDAARTARRLTDLVVATDDERIAEAVRPSGVDVCITSPDCPSGSDRAAEVIRNRAADVIVNLQGDEPKLEGEVIDAVVDALLESDVWGVATPVVAIRNEKDFTSPHVVKAVKTPGGAALYFSRAPIPSKTRMTPADGESPGFIWGWKHLGLYAFRREALVAFTSWTPTPLEQREHLEQLRLLENGIKIRIVEVEKDSIGVDTPEELAELDRKLSALNP